MVGPMPIGVVISVCQCGYQCQSVNPLPPPPTTVLPNFPTLPHGVLSNQGEAADIFGCATW